MENIYDYANESSFLPPVKKYYLAHNVDLSHPDYEQVKVNISLHGDDIYY